MPPPGASWPATASRSTDSVGWRGRSGSTSSCARTASRLASPAPILAARRSRIVPPEPERRLRGSSGDERGAVEEAGQAWQDILDPRRAREVARLDAGQALDREWERDRRLNQRCEGVDDPVVVELDGRDLDDLLRLRAGRGHLEVDRYQ